MHFKTLFALVAASVALAAPAPQDMEHKHSEAANADPLPKRLHSPYASAYPSEDFPGDNTPMEVGHFYVQNYDLNQACGRWFNEAYGTYTLGGGEVASVRANCRITDYRHRLIAAYTTQFRKNGGTWSETGPTGDALYLTFLKRGDGRCNEVFPGYCYDEAQRHEEVRLE